MNSKNPNNIIEKRVCENVMATPKIKKVKIIIEDNNQIKTDTENNYFIKKQNEEKVQILNYFLQTPDKLNENNIFNISQKTRKEERSYETFNKVFNICKINNKDELSVTYFDYLITPIQSKIHQFISEINKKSYSENRSVLITENEEEYLNESLSNTIKNSINKKSDSSLPDKPSLNPESENKNKLFFINKKKKNKRHLLCPEQTLSVFSYFINKYNNLSNEELQFWDEAGVPTPAISKFYIILKNYYEVAKAKYKIENKKLKKPNKYRFYSSTEKDFCIRLSQEVPLQYVSHLCDVPVKSLKRWQLVGAKRLKGCGRKVKDPQLASMLHSWYIEYTNENKIKPSNKLIKKKAIEISSSSDFLASNGWLDKWKRKYGIICINEKKSSN